jgi:acetyl esterase/lipase
MTWPSSARLTAAFLLFLPSLLTVLPPGINAFWKLSIPVKETGFWLAPPCLALTAWCLLSWKTGWGARAASALFLAGALLYAYPLLRAIETARHLEKEFARGFGKIPLKRPVEFLRPRPLVWKDFLRGIHASSVRPVTRTYARKRETDLRLDFYPARASRESGRKAPCVVVVHGGGWDTGTRGQLPDLNPWLTGAGYAVAAIDYRLAPEHVYPAPVEDVSDALAYLKARAEDLGIDPERFVLLGRSAGGQIALQAAYTLKDPAIRAVVAYYAPADMAFGYSLPGNPLILDSRKVMDRYLGGSCNDDPERCRAASPLEFADAQSPPTLLLHGEPDVLVSFKHTVHLEEKLAARGVPHFSVKLPWATHGYDYMFSGPGSQISLYFLERFLARAAP